MSDAGKTVALEGTEAELVKLALERRHAAIQAAEQAFAQSVAPVAVAHAEEGSTVNFGIRAGHVVIDIARTPPSVAPSVDRPSRRKRNSR